MRKFVARKIKAQMINGVWHEEYDTTSRESVVFLDDGLDTFNQNKKYSEIRKGARAAGIDVRNTTITYHPADVEGEVDEIIIVSRDSKKPVYDLSRVDQTSI